MEENNTTTKNTQSGERGMSQVQPEEKRSWVSVAFIWIGTMICIPMLMVGGLFGGQLTIGTIFGVSLIGFAVCCVLMILGGIIGCDLGLNATMCSTRAFGMTGANFSLALVVFIAETGWFSVQTATCATAFNSLMGFMGVNFPFWLSCVIWGGVMLITAVYGVKWMSVLNYIAVPLLLVLCLYGAGHSINGAGWETISTAVPNNIMSVATAITMVIGLFALGATCNSDYTRYCKGRVDVIKASLIGVLPAAILMIMVGAIMALGTGTSDVTSMFAGLGLPVIAMLVLILATWTTNTGNAYMSGLALCKMFSIKDKDRAKATMGVGCLGIVVAIAGFANVMEGYVSIIGAAVPPVLGVVIADYWIICGGKAEKWKPHLGVNWIGIIAWVCGSGLALCETLGVFLIFSPALDGVIVSLVVYTVLYKAMGHTALAGKGEISIEEATARAK